MGNKDEKLHHFIKDKFGHIEMEIFSEDMVWYRIHFPRFEFSTGNQPLWMRLTDVFALLFAYNENEYKKFKKKGEQIICFIKKI